MCFPRSSRALKHSVPSPSLTGGLVRWINPHHQESFESHTMKKVLKQIMHVVLLTIFANSYLSESSDSCVPDRSDSKWFIKVFCLLICLRFSQRPGKKKKRKHVASYCCVISKNNRYAKLSWRNDSEAVIISFVRALKNLLLWTGAKTTVYIQTSGSEVWCLFIVSNRVGVG